MSKAAKPKNPAPSKPPLTAPAYVPSVPAEYGHDASVWTARQRLTWELQEKFLAAYVKYGSIRLALPSAGVSRTCVYGWQRNDPGDLRYMDRFDHALHVRRELLVDLAVDRVMDPQGNRGSDILLIFLVKGLWPERFNQVDSTPDDTARDLVTKLRQWQKRTKAEVEGEAKLVPVAVPDDEGETSGKRGYAAGWG